MAAKNTAFNFDEMDWDAYRQHRPAYTPELYKMIYDYHEENGGKTDSALDVGAGVGIVTKELLERFDHVTLNDASDLYVSQAREAFKSVGSDRLSFLLGQIEGLSPSHLANGPVDLITAGECLHWTDLQASVDRLLVILKPGGTLAAWLYGICPRFPETHPEGQQAMDKYFDRLTELYNERIGMDTGGKVANNINARLDNADFDPSLWRDVRRFQTCLGQTMITTAYPANESRVREGLEQRVDMGNDDFMSMHVDYEWLAGNLESIVPVIKPQVDCAEQLKGLEVAMKGERVTLQWPFALVLVSKR